MFDYKLVVAKLNQLLDLLKGALPDDFVKSLQVDINAGEWALALEFICSNLYEDDKQISTKAYELIREAGEMMDMKSETWEILQPQVQQ